MPDGKWVSKANLQTFWQMIRSKSLPTMVGDSVTSWLNEHVDPVGSAVVVDDTLTIQGAAADAKKTGDEISGLKEELNDNQFGIPPYMMSLFKHTNNLFSNFCNHITGMYYSLSNAYAEDSHLDHTVTPNWQGWLIRVKPNTTYTIGPVDFRIVFFKSDLYYDKAIQTTDLSDTNPSTIVSGNNSYWMALTQRIGRDMSAWMMVEGSSYPSSYISGFPQWVDMPIESSDKMTHMTIFYSILPINVIFTDSGYKISIPEGRILLDSGASDLIPPATLTVNSTNALFLCYDFTDKQWVVTQHITNHRLYCIGYCGYGIKQCLLNAKWASNYSSSVTDFSPYGIEPFQMSLFKKKLNLFSDFCYHISGAYYGQRSSWLSIITAPDWQGWLIRVKPNTTYTIGPVDFRIVFFNSILRTTESDEDLSNTNPNTLTTGAESVWMALTQRIKRDMSNWMMVEGDTYPASYTSGYPEWVNTPKSVTDKTIAFFGDSITAGSGWTGEPDSQGYHQYIHDLYGFTCLNYGYGGSGYVTDYTGTGGVRGIGEPGKGVPNTSGAFTPNHVRTRLAEVTPSELDGVVIFAGTNDWSHQVSLPDFATELDTVYDYYQNNFGNVPLLVMTPIHRLGDTASASYPIPLIDYVNTIIQKCREHGIPYIDTFAMSGLQPNNTGNSNVFFPRDDNSSHTIDGIHPNHLAHQRIARCIGETLNQMMLWNETAIR